MKIIVEDSDTIMKAHGLDNEEIQETLIKQMTVEMKDKITEEDNMVLRLKEDYDPNTINFKWNDTEEAILKISKEGFYYRGELVSDIHNVYERFNEWLTKIE